jgi:hypothetical protein
MSFWLEMIWMVMKMGGLSFYLFEAEMVLEIVGLGGCVERYAYEGSEIMKE